MCIYVCTVKLRYNGVLGTGLKGPLYPKSVISKIGYGWLTILGNMYSAATLSTRQFIQPPTLTPAVAVCLIKAGDMKTDAIGRQLSTATRVFSNNLN